MGVLDGLEDALFVGFDSSTQGLKATVIDGRFRMVHSESLNYDADLPYYETKGGVHRHADGVTVTSPALMWVEALDLLLQRMAADGCPFNRVVAVSGSGQQHGSVWLKNGALSALRGLDPSRSLKEQLGGVFATPDSPVWMDASTGGQCRELERRLGGAQAVADLTGSRAYERFTGNQIAKMWQTEPAVYEATERIALVSSFMASVLAGEGIPIEVSDGSGMNLMDFRARRWAPAALEATAPGLGARLGGVVASHVVAGKVHAYFCARYGFGGDVAVIPFAGDNPCSLAGLRLGKEGDFAISLGTSDTLFASVLDPAPSGVEGHVFASPVDPKAYMVMLVRQNGSLVREKVRDAAAGGSWDVFARLLGQTAPGNGGRIGFYFDEPEITPPVMKAGHYRFNADGKPAVSFSDAEEVRALVEGQFVSMRLHAVRAGLKPRRLLATGGASANSGIIRTASDVFGVPVYAADVTDTASLGAAYRALHGWVCKRAGRFVGYAETVSGAPEFRKLADPDPAANDVYTGMLKRVGQFEDDIIARS